MSYNINGVTNVTSRDLARSLEMSHGNLEYHFPNKEGLLLAIYGQMKKDISEVYQERGLSIDPFSHFEELLAKLEILHNKYSFFNLDVLEILRNYSKVNLLLKQTFQVRKEQMAHFYSRFREEGYFKEEIHPGMYLRLQHTIRILITFWKSQQEVLPYFALVQNNTMSTYIWELLMPHMTEKGLKAYENLVLTNAEKV